VSGEQAPRAQAVARPNRLFGISDELLDFSSEYANMLGC
jgi:hypothetical protein